MVRSVICDNCGQRIDVDEGHTRRKVRCPQCGVMSELAEAPGPTTADPRPGKRSGASEPAPPDAEDLAQQLWSEPDEKPPPKKRDPLPPPPPREEKPRPVRKPPPVEVTERKPLPPKPPRRAAQTWTAEDEDRSPYTLSGGPERKCPQCAGVLGAEASFCVHCGLDLHSGKKAAREYQPLTRYWEPISYETRF